MPIEIHVTLDCADVEAQAEFYAAALGYEPFGEAAQYRSLVPPPESGLPKLVLQQVDDAPKVAKNKLHLDLIVGETIDAEAERLEQLGAHRLSGPVAEAGTRWIVMADPEGNEFCLCVR